MPSCFWKLLGDSHQQIIEERISEEATFADFALEHIKYDTAQYAKTDEHEKGSVLSY